MDILRVATAVAPLLLLVTACSGKDDGDAQTTPSPSATATVPAGVTATIAAEALQAGAYGIEPVFPQVALPRMTGLFWVPGAPEEAVILAQHEGIVYRANLTAGDQPEAYLDISAKMIDGPGNEEGLLGFAFAPGFATSGEIYVHYTGGDPRRTVIERYREINDRIDPASAQTILEVAQPAANHNGGAIAFGPDGMLYIALGDGGGAGDPRGNGQNTSSLLGKILRVDVSDGDAGYASPSDNPFARGGGAPEVWAYGLRNPWRMSFDRETGALWAGDVGQNRYEEVNRVVRGGNYGWNVTEGPACFSPGDNCNTAGILAPRAWYGRDDGRAVTGGYVYRGAAMPELDGWYLYGDFGTGKLWAIDTTTEIGDPVLLAEAGVPIASFAEDPEGELYIVAFDESIYRVVR